MLSRCQSTPDARQVGTLRRGPAGVFDIVVCSVGGVHWPQDGGAAAAAATGEAIVPNPRRRRFRRRPTSFRRAHRTGTTGAGTRPFTLARRARTFYRCIIIIIFILLDEFTPTSITIIYNNNVMRYGRASVFCTYRVVVYIVDSSGTLVLFAREISFFLYTSRALTLGVRRPIGPTVKHTNLSRPQLSIDRTLRARWAHAILLW